MNNDRVILSRNVKAWKLSISPPQNGHHTLFTPINFVVQNVKVTLDQPNEYGSTGVRPFILKIIAANGKNFICVNVMLFGGLGVMIDLPLI
jgi:hypothetical protein